MVDRGIGTLGLGEEDAVSWFRGIECRVVDDHRERESFSSQERKIAEQPWDIQGRAGGSARRFDVSSTGMAIVVRPRLTTAIEEICGSANSSGSATVTDRICTSPSTSFVFGLLQAHLTVRVLDAFELAHESERVRQADVEVCEASARHALAGLVGELVPEGSIELARAYSL